MKHQSEQHRQKWHLSDQDGLMDRHPRNRWWTGLNLKIQVIQSQSKSKNTSTAICFFKKKTQIPVMRPIPETR